MLATALPDATIVGADYDQNAVDYARTNYKAQNLSFVVADIASWSTDSGRLGSFDAVVSFDTIEHVLHREIAFMRICEALLETGVLLLSTPCGRRTYNNLLPGWEHHKIEYGYPDLYNMVARFFRRIVTPGHPDYPAWEFWERKINAGKLRYYNRLNPVVCEQPIHITLPQHAILPEPADGVAPRGEPPPK